jgi:DNA-binding NtrC family response regulator
VDVQSEIGKGTRVTLYLPKAGREPENSLKSDTTESEHGRGTILLVEDNPEVAAVSYELLQQLGYAVRSASNANDALGVIKADIEIDLVFTDIVMAGSMDGLTLARAIKQIRPQMPVLLATGYSKAADNAKTKFPILRKPYQIQELGRAVAKLMAEARGEIEASNLVHLEAAKRMRAPKSERP